MCLREGKPQPATVADHIEPHKGDISKFFLGKLQSLCWPHHSGAKQFEELHGFSDQVGIDGVPVDPRHPFNRK
jgi:5-methylcytosine-specific restriction enzyme A